MIRVLRFRFSSINILIKSLQSKENDPSRLPEYQEDLLKLQERMLEQAKTRSVAALVDEQLRQQHIPTDLYNYFMLLRVISVEPDTLVAMQLLSYIAQNWKSVEQQDQQASTIVPLLKQQIRETERYLKLDSRIPIKTYFSVIQLFKQLFGEEQLPLQTIEHLASRTQQLSEIEFIYVLQGVQQVADSMPLQFWKALFQSCTQWERVLKNNGAMRRVLFELSIEIPKVFIYAVYERIVHFELQELQTSDFRSLQQTILLLKSIAGVSKLHNNNIPYLGQLRTYLEDGQTQKQLLRQFEASQSMYGIQHLTSFIKDHQIKFDQIVVAERQQLTKIQSSVTAFTENLHTINSNVSLLLKNGLTDISADEKSKLRDVVLKVYEASLDENTLKKVMVLSCRLFPNDIKMVQTSMKKCREFLNTQPKTKDSVSLAINCLFQMQMVQYNLVPLSKFYLEYILDAWKLNKDLVYTLNPQEISSIYYYIAKQRHKQSKKELLSISMPEDVKVDVNVDLLVQLLELLMPAVQYQCSKDRLRLKVIYTIVDCYSKFFQHLKGLDLRYLFEKIEANLMEEIHKEMHQDRKVEEKDIDFLYWRLNYMKVGSRKLIRFLQSAQETFRHHENTLRKVPAAQPSFRRAVLTYKKRERVYNRMRQRRRSAIFASVQGQSTI